jgi:integrase/recombinase XerD
MLATLYNTGARVSELIGMKVGDIVLDRSSSICIHGKGRKERTVPLWRTTAKQIRLWLRQNQFARDRPLFPNRTGGPMTRTGVTDRLKLAAATAAMHCPQLKKRRISPHIVRHATAMHSKRSSNPPSQAAEPVVKCGYGSSDERSHGKTTDTGRDSTDCVGVCN